MIRGRAIHNVGMVNRLHQVALDHGAPARVEAYLGPNLGYADLLIEAGDLKVIVEAERSPRRVHRDLAKAAAIHATHLFIATPTRRLAERIGVHLRRYPLPPDLVIEVRPLAQAAQGLHDLLSRSPRAQCAPDSNAGNSKRFVGQALSHTRETP